VLLYRFLSEDDTSAFCHKVSEALSKGWVLHGNPTYAFDAERKVAPWSELPVWLPDSNKDTRGMLAVDISRATADGLQTRPIADTARDTLAWHKTRGESHEWRAGMKRERERELLAEWEER
jgi:hypothetical protein